MKVIERAEQLEAKLQELYQDKGFTFQVDDIEPWKGEG